MNTKPTSRSARCIVIVFFVAVACLLTVPAAFTQATGEVHWHVLNRARAIENAVWMAGCCVAGSIYSGEDFSGAGNYVFDPLGEPVRTGDDHTYRLETDRPPRRVVDPREHPYRPAPVEVFEIEEDA